MNYSDIIVKHYEICLEKHGDGCKAVDWPNENDAAKRYKVMMDVRPITLCHSTSYFLDYGCGVGGLLEFIKDIYPKNIHYVGYDKSEKMISRCMDKFEKNKNISLTETNMFFFTPTLLNVPVCEYVIMNGVFTEKLSLTYAQAMSNMKKTLLIAWSKCSIGLAFNVMSKNVTHERDDLFHVPMDTLTKWICKNLSCHFIIRADYGLYEYTIYVYRDKS